MTSRHRVDARWARVSGARQMRYVLATHRAAITGLVHFLRLTRAHDVANRQRARLFPDDCHVGSDGRPRPDPRPRSPATPPAHRHHRPGRSPPGPRRRRRPRPGRRRRPAHARAAGPLPRGTRRRVHPARRRAAPAPAGLPRPRRGAGPALLRTLTAGGSGVVEMAALGSAARPLGFAPAGAGGWAVVGLPAPATAAGRAFADGVGWIAVIGILVLLAAVVGSERLLRRRIEHLVAATRALAAGDFGTRPGWTDTDGELGQVGQAFDEMAAAIERLTRRTELILEAVGEAIVGVDAEEHVTFLNGVAAALLGGSVGDLVGRSLHGVLREATGGGPGCPLCAAVAAGAVVQSSDALLVKADGTALAVEYTCTPKRDGGRTTGVVVALKDISARKRTDQERQRQRDTLHQRDKLASMATLLADVAHELNNPLTVIIAGATLLRDATTDDAVRRRAELLEQAAERCALTIRNFLALVRQYPATREEVALDRIVKETLALVAYQLEVDEISVDVALPRDVPPVWADPHQLHQVLLNLVTNARHALRATPPPRRLSIAVRHEAEARRVVLEVADSGPGVAPELRSHVFRPFFTTKSPEEGTGLGLALCHDIVAAHGGAIRVDSAAGGGAL